MNSINLYFKFQDKYFRFYKFDLRSNGFYLIDNSWRGDHFSYHVDGTCFYHLLGERKIKKIRNPLKELSNIESLRCLNVIMHDPSLLQLAERAIKKQDIVIEELPPFCLEIIISNKRTILPKLPDRIRKTCFQRKIGHIWLTIEVFKHDPSRIAVMRYDSYKWVLGKNFFMWIDNKWQ